MDNISKLFSLCYTYTLYVCIYIYVLISILDIFYIFLQIVKTCSSIKYTDMIYYHVWELVEEEELRIE